MSKVIPFVNWAGGKTQLISQMSPFFPQPDEYDRYIEPFVGGGVVFLRLGKKEAILGDSNDELMNCYQVVRDNVETVIKLLSKHIPDKQYYYRLRQQDPKGMDLASRAARFIYLNKTCFNGVYRVNLKGRFNVPYGKREAKIYYEENLRKISLLLQNAVLVAQSYEKTLEQARAGDFVYLDPPYHPLSKTSNFTKYTSKPFGEEDHTRLAKEFHRLTELGCMVMLSNSNTTFIRELYLNYHMKPVKARRYVNCNGNGRKAITELLILNYQPPCFTNALGHCSFRRKMAQQGAKIALNLMR